MNVSARFFGIATLSLLLLAGSAAAAEVNLNGVIGNKALLVIDDGKPRWLTVGETVPGGIKLLSIAGESAIIELEGKRQTITMGQSARLAGGAPSAGNKSVTLVADGRGHFVTNAIINGVTVRVLVDTGATVIAMGSSVAQRLGIDYLSGQRARMSTANGMVMTYSVKLDEVRLGDITLNNVDATVHPGDNMNIVLLGMSFLNRMEMKRDGDKMVLTKRY